LIDLPTAWKPPVEEELRSITYTLSFWFVSFQATWISLPDRGAAVTLAGGNSSADATPAPPSAREATIATLGPILNIRIRAPHQFQSFCCWTWWDNEQVPDRARPAGKPQCSLMDT
jgi:hypothetical protein